MNKTNTHIKDDLLVKYLLKEASPAEQLQVEKWMEADKSNLSYFNAFKLIIETSQLNPDNAVNESEALSRLHQRMQKESGNSKGKNLFSVSSFIRIAAAILIVGTIIWFTYPLLYNNAKLVAVQTNGGVLQQTLPDGSTVRLNKNSFISYPGKFAGNIRSVQLKGEAFFEVKSDKEQPFVIKVNDISVKVVGTSFNIKSRNNQTVVIVKSGIVEVTKDNEHIKLHAGEKVQVHPGMTGLLKETSKGRLYDYYFSNELVCDGTPLSELMEILNEKFEVNIIITRPSLKELPLTTVFHDESLDQILKVIAATFNINVEYQGKQILLK
ncbi:MAG TPA: FecR domain-containing protein [Daejeonella sp.]|uniref:FecR family protein n=1 Tax=Daejeonella sp. TaxID=2805397 RepID=UPI002EDB2041